MKFTTNFSRRVGAVGLDPLLGTDLVPAGLVFGSETDVTIPQGSDTPPSLVLAYRYIGAGVAPDVTMTIYALDEDNGSWWRLPDVDLASGVLVSVWVPNEYVAAHRAVARTVLRLVPLANGSEPDGQYEFHAGSSIGMVGEGISASSLATIAQDATLQAVLASIEVPTKHTAITPDDATDITSIANFGVIVGTGGKLEYFTVGSPAQVSLDVVDGQVVYGQFEKVMAATTATGLVGVAK